MLLHVHTTLSSWIGLLSWLLKLVHQGVLVGMVFGTSVLTYYETIVQV